MNATQAIGAMFILLASDAPETTITIRHVNGGPQKEIVLDQTGGFSGDMELGSATGQLSKLDDVATWLTDSGSGMVVKSNPLYTEEHGLPKVKRDDAADLPLQSVTAGGSGAKDYIIIDGYLPAPVIEKVAEVVETRVNVTDSFLGPVTAKRATRINDEPFGDRFVLIAQDEPPAAEEENLIEAGGSTAAEKIQRFDLHIHSLFSDDSQVPSATQIQILMADIIASLTRRPNWHDFDGHAFNARFAAEEPFVTGNGEYSGVTLPLLVDFRHAESNPYVRR